MENIVRLQQILAGRGFAPIAGVPDVTATSEYVAPVEILDELGRFDIPARNYLVRSIHWENEWHDEALTQVQVLLVASRVGLGTGVDLAKGVLGELYGAAQDIQMKSEFIPGQTPAVELLVDDRNVAAVGYIHTQLMEDAGLTGYSCVVITFIAERL